MTDKLPQVIRGAVIDPPRQPGLEMPHGVPGATGFFSGMRYAAIKRVLDQYELALQSASSVRVAEAEYNRSLARRAESHERLMNIDDVRAIERRKLQAEAEDTEGQIELARLRRQLERLKLETEIAQQRRQLEQVSDAAVETNDADPEFDKLLVGLARMPKIAEAIVSSRAEVVKAFGGEDALGEEGQQLVEALGAFAQAIAQKGIGEKLE